MSVTRSCDPGNGWVELAVSEGEFLEYRIPQAHPDIQYVLVDGEGTHLFENVSCPPGCVHRWPQAAAPPAPGEVRHALAMQFFGEESLRYEVDRRSAAGALIEVVKSCTFHNAGGPDEFLEALRIHVS